MRLVGLERRATAANKQTNNVNLYIDYCSAFAPVNSCVPHGSALGPMLLFMYIKPLSTIIESHNSFGVDLQLQMSAPTDKMSKLLHYMQSCISDIKA